MATTVEVSTWAELSAACHPSGTVSFPYTIKLLNDIDMNDGYSQGVSQYIYSEYSGSAAYIIDGDGHTIRNLRNPITGGHIFYTDYGHDVTYKFQNIDFVNLILSGGHFLNLYPQSSGAGRMGIVMENCRFVGYRTGNSYLINQYDNITCTSCYFDMPWYGAGSSVYDYTSLVYRGTPTTNIPTANYCWFHESYGGWTLSSASGSSSPIPDYSTTQCCMFAMNGCYIDGTMKRPVVYTNGGTTATMTCYVYRRDIGSYYTASTPNVVDMHWFCSNLWTTVRTFEPCALNMNGVFSEQAEILDNPITPTYYRTSTGSQPDVILATPEQMEDVDWLRAQGFPIIDPTPVED